MREDHKKGRGPLKMEKNGTALGKKLLRKPTHHGKWGAGRLADKNQSPGLQGKE